MKRLVLLLSLFILVRPALPLADYFINYGYIITNLCINRDKPELECNGKCYLKDELALAAQNDIPFSENHKLVTFGFQILFFQEVNPIFFPNFSEEKTGVKALFHDLYLSEWSQKLLRPPIS